MKKIDVKLSSDKIFGMEPEMLQIFLIPGVVFLVILVVVLGLVVPKIGEIAEMRKNTATVAEETRKLAEKRDYLKSVDQQELQDNADFLASALLREKNAYYLVNVVRNIVSKFGFQVDSFSVSLGKLTKEDGEKEIEIMAAKIPVTIVVLGPKDKYLDLVATIEKSLPILEIQNFDMKAEGETVMISLGVASFYVSTKAEATATSLTLTDLMMSQKESELLSTIRSFETVGTVTGIESGTKEFVKYDRTNPFNP
ncbi:MAG: hypothetical protein WC596_02530 [Candidatus Shapirobacteria bacterium]